MTKIFVVLASCLVCTFAQRSPYAGNRPIGYPELETTSTTVDPLANKFGEVTTERLPIEALGDRELVNRISKLPIDQQPFWYINWKALEEHRKNPQTYPQKETPFIENLSPQPNQGNGQGTVQQAFPPPQGGFPQRFPQNNNAGQNNNAFRTENRIGGVTNQNRNGPTHSQLITYPGLSNQDDIDHIQGMPNNDANKNENVQGSSNNGDIDHLLGMPRNDSKRNTHFSQSQGNQAIRDFSKYFMARN